MIGINAQLLTKKQTYIEEKEKSIRKNKSTNQQMYYKNQ